ncbi:hypothetical protein [Brevibacillus porteri]|uniref:hypothetical protein n=1 Tax=Brevibacillus porteri TaxID=2126350 RepID=UPI003D23FD54
MATEMVNAASSDNVMHFMIKSGYRSLEKPGKLAEEKGHVDDALPDCFKEQSGRCHCDRVFVNGTGRQSYQMSNKWRA